MVGGSIRRRLGAILVADFVWYAAGMPLMSLLPDEPGAPITGNIKPWKFLNF